MAKQQPTMSNEALFIFMEKIESSVTKIEDNVDKIKDSVSKQRSRCEILQSRLDSHVENEETVGKVKDEFGIKLGVVLTVVGLLLSVIFFGIGYHSKTVERFKVELGHDHQQ